MVDAGAIVSILAFIIEIITCASYFNMFSGKGRVKTGHKPSDGGGWGNMGYYCDFSVFALGILSLTFAIVELLMVLRGFVSALQSIKFLEILESPILRGVVYIVKGIATLGTSGDLGIAAGSLELIIGVVIIVLSLMGKLGAQKTGGK